MGRAPAWIMRCTGLDHALHRPLVRLFGHISASIRDDVDLEPLLERRQCGTDDAYARPQAGEREAALADPIHLGDQVHVFPAVHRGAVNDFVIGKHLLDFVECRTGEALLRYGRDDGGHLEFSRRF